jgi:lipoate-protein ligase A
VNDEVEELYDYGALRALAAPTMLVVRSAEPTFVLGGSQSIEVLKESDRDRVALRRRRGGGGVVALQPDDVWIDWWIPASDERWSPDVHVMSRRVGEWWRATLTSRLRGEVALHEGPMTGDPAWRVACFAARGPGEVMVDGRKAVGVTQWRVREGVFLSTVLHAHPSRVLLDILAQVPQGVAAALDHHTLATLGLDGDDLTQDLIDRSTPVEVRQLLLIA